MWTLVREVKDQAEDQKICVAKTAAPCEVAGTVTKLIPELFADEGIHSALMHLPFSSRALPSGTSPRRRLRPSPPLVIPLSTVS